MVFGASAILFHSVFVSLRHLVSFVVIIGTIIRSTKISLIGSCASFFLRSPIQSKQITLTNPKTQSEANLNFNLKPKALPYYFKGGTVYPQPAKLSKELGRRDAKLLPFEDPDSDRVENQMMFVPPNYAKIRKSNRTKSIVFYNGIEGLFDVNTKATFFTDRKCLVTTCTLSEKAANAEDADLIIFSGQYTLINLTRTPKQIYAFYRFALFNFHIESLTNSHSVFYLQNGESSSL